MEPLIEGYYIQWRLPNSPDTNYIKVGTREAQSAIVNGLKPFTHYDFFVTPYHGPDRGRPSNSLEGKTDEAREYFHAAQLVTFKLQLSGF